MQTLLLSVDLHDLVADADGNIAVASDPYSAAQDVACAERLFQGEAYYDTSRGIPYWQILGRTPPLSLLKAYWVSAALSVQGVASAVAYITSVAGRLVSGQVQITDTTGTTSTVTVGPSSNPPGYAITDTGIAGLVDGQNMVAN